MATDPNSLPSTIAGTGTVLSLDQIQIRDPYVLTVEDEGRYFLFGTTDQNPWSGPATGFDCYESTDLSRWDGPIAAFRPPEAFWSRESYWAPEVHEYQGRYCMFATFSEPDYFRGTQVLVADDPSGPFAPWSDGPVTPRDCQCLDGTLHVDDAGDPWIVFCHEWLQIHDGAIVAQRLASDLRSAIDAPTVLFNASEAPWARPFGGTEAEASWRPNYVTDGPFLHHLSSGNLIMLWSSFGDHGYAMGVARSASGSVLGPWHQEDEPVWGRDGGHGMIATTLAGQLLLVFHQPNDTPNERAVLREIVELEDTITLVT